MASSNPLPEDRTHAMTPRPSTLDKLVGLALVAGLVILAAPWSSSTLIAQDDEREFRRLEAKRSFVENCLMCHGEDMTTRQRLTAKQWSASVEKMVNWGTPLPPDRKQPLIDYLAETYPTTQPAPPLERISPDRALALDPQPTPKALPSADLARGEALFAAHCAVCHASNARGGDLGTNLVEKPVLLREEEYRALIRDGRRRMPGFAAVLDERGQADLLAWLRRQR
jgi:mono/diheme cytochrome c family protein